MRPTISVYVTTKENNLSRFFLNTSKVSRNWGFLVYDHPYAAKLAVDLRQHRVFHFWKFCTACLSLFGLRAHMHIFSFPLVFPHAPADSNPPIPFPRAKCFTFVEPQNHSGPWGMGVKLGGGVKVKASFKQRIIYIQDIWNQTYVKILQCFYPHYSGINVY